MRRRDMRAHAASLARYSKRKDDMNPNLVRLARLSVSAGTALLLAISLGCNSSTAGKDQESSAGTATKTAASSRSDDPGIDLQCAAQRIQKPSAPFHWSYKKHVSTFGDADWEADVTPDSITGMIADSSGSRPVHGVRTDGTGWNTAVLVLAGPLPASTFALVNNSSATMRAGTEKVDGQDTIKYSIDTVRDTPADASLIRSVLGPNGFIKGVAWVTSEGCPVKFVLDVEQHTNDGRVEKEHYEEAMTKK